MSRLKYFGLLMILVGISATVVSAKSPTDNGAIDAFVQERMTSLNIPGAALAIMHNGEITYIAGYGTANVSGDPITPQTPFLLASLSKSMTAVAVMQLVEAGKVALDDPIQEYLPWFIPETPITVRQLLNQTSGLDEGQGYDRNLDPDGTDALAQSIHRLATTDLNNTPGAVFEYSNSNYDVLGLLVETVSGQPYDAYIQANLFEPLAMTQSFTSLAEARTEGMSSAFYPFFGRPTNMDAVLPYSRATQPSAGLIGSAEDMAHYVMMHLQDGRFGDTQLLTSASIETLHTPDITGGSSYAMGWAVWPFDDAASPGEAAPTALSHGGQWLGFNHTLLFIPEKDWGMVLLLNSNDPATSSAYSNIAFDVALLALGREVQNYPPGEDWLSRHLRPLSVVVIILLFIIGFVALRRLRGQSFTRQDSRFFVGTAILDWGLVIYLLFIRLPNNESSIPLVMRFEPDLGIMLLVLLLLTAVWGSVRSLWALHRWRTR